MIVKFNQLFEEILLYAERNQVCLRKAVGCAAVTVINDVPALIYMKHNGPSRDGHECSNEVGNCGCSHAEPRVVQGAIEGLQDASPNMPLILLCTYSPCTNCANIIIDSGLFCGCIYSILTQHDTRGREFLKEAMPVMTVGELNKLTEKDACDKIKKWISDRERR
jgi:deoxycytidylate deaminase